MVESRSAGSTLAGIVVQEDSVVAFNAGDSPIVWTGGELGGGILGGSEDHDCRNEAEIDRIRTFAWQGYPSMLVKMGKSWHPCHESNGLRMKKSGTMTTRGLGDVHALQHGFSNEPEIQTIPLPNKGENGPRWFILASDGIVSDLSDTFAMQLALSRGEMVKFVALGFEENGTDIGVRERLDEMMAIGNSFPITGEVVAGQEQIPDGLKANPSVMGEFPPGSGKRRYVLDPEIFESLPALPESVADDTFWRPRRKDGTPVTHGNGDDCSILVVRVK